MKLHKSIIYSHIAFTLFMILINTHSNAQHPEPNNMVAVIFEVTPADGHKEEYLDIARTLRPQLDSIDGFISIERFESLTTPGKILSLSFWRNEDAVKQWRNTDDHRLAQQKGRNGIFKDYRLRVVTVLRDYGLYNRSEAPTDSKAVHDVNVHHKSR
jgi:heme-degrading monooxygenase HmoA